MEIKRKAKGSWGIRFFIVVLGITLGFLFFWLLSFAEGDIGDIKGPDWDQVRRTHISIELDGQQKTLGKEVDDLRRGIKELTERKNNLSRSTSSLQNTISQLLSIQERSLAKNVQFPEESAKTLRESQSAFLENQREDLKFNREID